MALYRNIYELQQSVKINVLINEEVEVKLSVNDGQLTYNHPATPTTTSYRCLAYHILSDNKNIKNAQ